MTTRRKYTYLVIIVICGIGILAVLMFLEPSLPGVDLTPTPTPTGGLGTGAIQVFPRTKEFNLSLFDSSKFKLLKEYEPLIVNLQELGRDNPFEPYR